jgi:hypothetical protein
MRGSTVLQLLETADKFKEAAALLEELAASIDVMVLLRDRFDEYNPGVQDIYELLKELDRYRQLGDIDDWEKYKELGTVDEVAEFKEYADEVSEYGDADDCRRKLEALDEIYSIVRNAK